jgi:hypothetical protein
MRKRKAGKAASKAGVKVEDEPNVQIKEEENTENLTEYELQRFAMYVENMLFTKEYLGTELKLSIACISFT